MIPLPSIKNFVSMTNIDKLIIKKLGIKAPAFLSMTMGGVPIGKLTGTLFVMAIGGQVIKIIIDYRLRNKSGVKAKFGTTKDDKVNIITVAGVIMIVIIAIM